MYSFSYCEYTEWQNTWKNKKFVHFESSFSVQKSQLIQSSLTFNVMTSQSSVLNVLPIFHLFSWQLFQSCQVDDVTLLFIFQIQYGVSELVEVGVVVVDMRRKTNPQLVVVAEDRCPYTVLVPQSFKDDACVCLFQKTFCNLMYHCQTSKPLGVT